MYDRKFWGIAAIAVGVSLIIQLIARGSPVEENPNYVAGYWIGGLLIPIVLIAIGVVILLKGRKSGE